MTHSSFSEVRLSAAILEDTRTFLLLSENSRVPQDFKAARKPAPGPKGSMRHFTCETV